MSETLHPKGSVLTMVVPKRSRSDGHDSSAWSAIRTWEDQGRNGLSRHINLKAVAKNSTSRKERTSEFPEGRHEGTIAHKMRSEQPVVECIFGNILPFDLIPLRHSRHQMFEGASFCVKPCSLKDRHNWCLLEYSWTLLSKGNICQFCSCCCRCCYSSNSLKGS